MNQHVLSTSTLRITFKQLERLQVLAVPSGPGMTGAVQGCLGSWSVVVFGIMFLGRNWVASAQALQIRPCVGTCNDSDEQPGDQPPGILFNLQMTSLWQNIAQHLWFALITFYPKA